LSHPLSKGSHQAGDINDPLGRRAPGKTGTPGNTILSVIFFFSEILNV
jgi:hypothetical protein